MEKIGVDVHNARFDCVVLGPRVAAACTSAIF